MVGQAPRGGDNHVWLPREIQCLCHHIWSEGRSKAQWMGSAGTHSPPQPLSPHTHAANDNAVLQTQGLPQHPELLSDLVGQLPVGEKQQQGQ